jgi:hypothetical protein
MPRQPPKPGYESAFISRLHPNASIKLDEKHFAAIGRVAAAWSLLEYAIDRAITHLSAASEERGYCVTSQIFGASNKIKAFTALLELHQFEKKKIAKANEIQQRVFYLSDKRNRFVHDVWIRDAKSADHFRHQMINKQGKLMLENVPVDLTEADKLTSDITTLRLAFVNFWMRLPSGGMFPTTSILLQ